LNKHQLIIDTLNKKERAVIPFHLDLTDKVRERLITHFGDPNFEQKVGNSLALERNESFVVLGNNKERDMFGVVWNKDQEGDFGVIEHYLLQEPNLDGYIFPQPEEALIRQKCERLVKNHKDQFTMYTIGFSLFERAWALRGMTDLLMDFLLNPAFVEELLDRIVEYNLSVMDIAMEYDIDCIFFGDDWGQQKGMIMGPALWKQFLKPRLAKMYAKAKSKGLYVAQHSCGDVHEIFPDLIEIGLDIYNTFQPEIYDVEKIKKEFGKDITLYGGISTQQLLPKASPEEVKAETRRLMKLLGKGGGYIVAPTHAIPDDVPTENILAFLEVVQNQ